ncbi:MAG: hypothetical protein EXS44_02990 [Candidatus Levybacteria bacterium]|nr:hypothetical protein [Candidatus Levybacteria bacterium]
MISTELRKVDYTNDYEVLMRQGRILEIGRQKGLGSFLKSAILASVFLFSSYKLNRPNEVINIENERTPIIEPKIESGLPPAINSPISIDKQNLSSKFTILPTDQVIEVTVRNDSQKNLGIKYREEPLINSKAIVDSNDNLVILKAGEKIGYINNIYIEERTDGSVGLWGKTKNGFFSLIDPEDNNPLVNLRHKDNEENTNPPTTLPWIDFLNNSNQLNNIINKKFLNFSIIYNPSNESK